MEKRKKHIWVILIIFGLVLIANLLGLIVEFLFTAGVVSTDLARVRTIHPISFTLTVAFIISNAFFLIYTYKQKKKALLFWHIFMGISLLNTLYQVIVPTYISLIVPNYFILVPLATIGIWGGIFYVLEKSKLT